MTGTSRARHLLGPTPLALLLALFTGACAAPMRKPPPALFFPQPPELPRIQYLTSLTGSKDIESQSGFDRFVVGERANATVDKPYGVAMHDGKIYVCDTNGTVVLFDMKGREFGSLPGAVGQGELRQPTNISITPEGLKYVADPKRGQVVVFDAADEYVRAYGTPGPWRPVDAVPFKDRLYVVDAGEHVVKVFDLGSGEIVKSIGGSGAPTERLDRPTNVAIDRDGYLYVTDIARFQVVKFDRDGHFESAFGKPGSNVGHFARPKGAAVDRHGHLLVVDAAFNNVQLFDRDGRILLYFGEAGDEPGQFMLPAKVAIDDANVGYFQEYADPSFEIEYLILVTSQFGRRRVNVLAYGRDRSRTYPTEEELRKQIEQKRRNALEKVEPEPGPEEPDAPSSP